MKISISCSPIYNHYEHSAHYFTFSHRGKPANQARGSMVKVHLDLHIGVLLRIIFYTNPQLKCS